MVSRAHQDAWLLGQDQAPVEKGPRTFEFHRDRVKLADVSWMCDKLATMQGAGLPLFQSVATLARMKAGTPLGRRLDAIYDDIGEGSSFAQAMRKFESDFEPLTCALVETGEASGNLTLALERAAKLIDTRLRLRRKVRAAMTYPAVVLTVTSLLIAGLLVFIVPKFEAIYAEAGGDLPAMTQALVSLSKVLPFVIAGIIVAVLVVVLLLRSSATGTSAQRQLDAFKLRLPIVGPLMAKAADARVAATLANLLGAGVPLLDALTLTARTANNERLSTALLAARTSIDDGSGFADALADTGAFPEILVQLASVGEDSGTLPRLMERYAVVAEEEVMTSAETITSVIEPLLMVLVGLIVGVFLIGLYLPLISIGDQIR
jgi:type IV pilus assembly protein PilC